MDENKRFRKIETQIREITEYIGVQKIIGGFSREEKYLLTCSDKRQYLVRITPHADSEVILQKKNEYELINTLRTYSQLIPTTFAFGISSDETLCFMILQYIEGTDGEKALNSLSEPDQYQLGVLAGKELKRLHAMPAPSGIGDWPETVSNKYTSKEKAFDTQGIMLQGIDRGNLDRFIIRNIPFIQTSDKRFLHGDYHPANLIIHEGDLRGIIDFNRYDWGDPVHDFLKVAFFTRAVSVPFAAGQIDGYHNGPPPPLFWKKYVLYIAMTLIPDLLWSHDYARINGSSQEINRSRKRIEMVCFDHEGFMREIPVWYQSYQDRTTTGVREK